MIRTKFINPSVSGLHRTYAAPPFVLNIPGAPNDGTPAEVETEVPSEHFANVVEYLGKQHPAIQILPAVNGTAAQAELDAAAEKAAADAEAERLAAEIVAQAEAEKAAQAELDAAAEKAAADAEANAAKAGGKKK